MTAIAPQPGAPGVVLASASKVRRQLLENAGVAITVIAAAVDEDEVKRALKASRATADQCAETLAELKATRVAGRAGGALVIGCDQMLDLDGTWFDKPIDRDHARAHLQTLSGRTHRLISAAVVLKDGARIWHHVAVARLTMRALSPGFIDAYLDAVGGAALSSVGAYQLEGLGAQLFARIEGDYFTVLGLPLLPLLDFLRAHGVVRA